ncbi:MAG: hypothetical protein DRO99_04615 [Candidatus Aenigmatarchaeota archaeon]|nr:MAG: hypothetical protein DRO99_04615 [Candidatus Aenigmarchaeota archaeon]
MIAAPFASIEEMKLLIREGADEFYCGVCTEDVSGVNDRLNNDRYNLKDMEELRKAVRIAHDNGKSVYITVNKPVLDLNLSGRCRGQRTGISRFNLHHKRNQVMKFI